MVMIYFMEKVVTILSMEGKEMIYFMEKVVTIISMEDKEMTLLVATKAMTRWKGEMATMTF